MVSGHVYQLGSVDLGEPTLSGVLITIQQPDGLRQTALTDATGFYTLSATFGPVVIMAMKPGFRVRHSRFNLADDTVLNFSLTPTPQDAGTAARLELH